MLTFDAKVELRLVAGGDSTQVEATIHPRNPRQPELSSVTPTRMREGLRPQIIHRSAGQDFGRRPTARLDRRKHED
jgi:hypothetical protein